MKVLIFTGKFGMGHSSVSIALKEEIKSKYKNADILIIDILEYLLPHTNKLIYFSFTLLVNKFSSLYNVLNKTAEKYNTIPFRKYIVKKLQKLIIKNSPDIIISTLPISTKYLSAYKEDTNDDIKLLTYITDICTHEEWIAPKNDYYFVGAKEIKKELINLGIPKSNIFVSGIPVKQEFKNLEPKIKETKSKKEVLIMGGGFGLIPISNNIFDYLNSNASINTTVITGSNTKLYNKLKRKYTNLNIIGFTNEVYKYMNKADLLITKSGGITLFEAIYTNTPIYVINPFLLQEKANAKYIEKTQIGKVIWNKKYNVIEDINNLLNSKKDIEIYKKNINVYKNSFEKKNSLFEIIEKSLENCL